MPTSTPKRIHLKGSGRHEEGVAGGAVTPGHLVSLASTGKYVVHASSGGVAERLYALEDALQGNTIADDYALDDQLMMVAAQPGDNVYAILAAGENVAIGDKLSSNGDGTLQKQSSTEATLAIALEALDLSASDAEDSHLIVRVV